MSHPALTVLVAVGALLVAVWAVRAELAHRRDRVTGLLATVRSLAATDLDAAAVLHHRAATVARWLPRDTLADTDQWLLDVGPVAAIPPAPPTVVPAVRVARFGIVARPRPDQPGPALDGLDLIGTTRIRPVVPLDPPPRRGGTDGRGRARVAGETPAPGRGRL